MAEAPGHRLGQIIGNALELAIEPFLKGIADEYSLFLDKHGERPARPGLKLTWKDSLGNKHDLDFVLERGGSPTEQGVPVAFIESAWRRYTKHSRNKAQEIQGAVLPLLATHAESKPFAGVVLAGVFTDGSLKQLRSNGFSVLYIPYKQVVAAFEKFGMDVDFDESTSDAYLRDQIDVYDDLSERQLAELGSALAESVPGEFDAFGKDLRKVLDRRVERVRVLALHGGKVDFPAVAEAIQYIAGYSHPDGRLDFVRFEITVVYSNGDRIVAEFQAADDAVRFLATFGD